MNKIMCLAIALAIGSYGSATCAGSSKPPKEYAYILKYNDKLAATFDIWTNAINLEFKDPKTWEMKSTNYILSMERYSPDLVGKAEIKKIISAEIKGYILFVNVEFTNGEKRTWEVETAYLRHLIKPKVEPKKYTLNYNDKIKLSLGVSNYSHDIYISYLNPEKNENEFGYNLLLRSIWLGEDQKEDIVEISNAQIKGDTLFVTVKFENGKKETFTRDIREDIKNSSKYL